eukprot:5502_1
MSHQSSHLPDGYEFYKKIGSPKFICAPMVEQSELPFRLLCRSYNIPLCYSPMINSKHYLEHPKYAEVVFQTCPDDRPLIAQFCGNDPDLILSAAKRIEHLVDAIDLNFGCPQQIAKKGHYGAFLLSEVDTMCRIVNKLYHNLSIPICAKIRIVSTASETLRICKSLRENGISLLTVHGRVIDCRKQKISTCDFDMIKQIKDTMDIPVFANGGCETYDDVIKCLERTGCDGYMAAESILSNPSLFCLKERRDAFEIGREYIALCKLCKNEKQWVMRHKHVAMKGHLFKILYRELTVFQDIRNRLGATDNVEWIWNVVDLLDMRRKAMDKHLYRFVYETFSVNWYHRHWKSYETLERMNVWDSIVSECTMPIEENQFELIQLMVKYKCLDYDECKEELGMCDEEIERLKQGVKIEAGKDKIEEEITDTNHEANLVNSMFGMHDDDDSDDSESIIYDVD